MKGGGTAERRNGGTESPRGARTASRPTTPALPGNALRFKRALLRWFRRDGRDLPWRATRDPYHVAVSEFMLQQTQVTRVLEYYPRFLRRFPTIESLAQARPATVREAWEGLGYYRRAENLHRLARTVVRDYGGTVPADPDTLERLPGVGRYTAGAIATFAYERRAAAVDTNVARVLQRVFRTRRRNGETKTGRNGGTAERAIWEMAERLVPRSGSVAWEFNQALMDLGARICVARKPRCAECPVHAACRTGMRRPL